jgi:hypothetical protein
MITNVDFLPTPITATNHDRQIRKPKRINKIDRRVGWCIKSPLAILLDERP